MIKQFKTIMRKMQHSILGAAASLAAFSIASAVLLCGCSKDLQEQQAVGSLSDEDVELTIEVTGDTGTRTTISQSGTILPVVWAEGDCLQVVGATDGYLGTVELTTDAGKKTATFKGTVKGWSKAQKLHIYYLGAGVSLTSAQSTYTFDISSQQGTLAGIASNGHIAHGVTDSDVAVGALTIPTVTLSNLNAVVLFDLSAWTSGTTISGTYSKAVLDLKTGDFTTDKTDGSITIPAEGCTATTYVAFIPDTRALTFTQGSYSTSALANTTEAGCFYSNNGSAVAVPRFSGSVLSGKFTVDASGKKVQFSKGNLQAKRSATGPVTAHDGSTWAFSFAEHQYDYIGKGNVSGSALGNTIDLFGWSSSDTGAHLYGISTSTTNSDYGTSTDASSFKDWGKIATLPGNTESKQIWYTLSSAQWAHLLSTRNVNGGTSEGHSYQRTTLTLSDGKTKVYGLIIVPDDFSGTLSGTTSWSDWQTMESKGCAFLSGAGTRLNGTTLSNVNAGSYYWSATPSSSEKDRAYGSFFYDGSVVINNANSRALGYSVRLVCDAAE